MRMEAQPEVVHVRLGVEVIELIGDAQQKRKCWHFQASVVIVAAVVVACVLVVGAFPAAYGVASCAAAVTTIVALTMFLLSEIFTCESSSIRKPANTQTTARYKKRDFTTKVPLSRSVYSVATRSTVKHFLQLFQCISQMLFCRFSRLFRSKPQNFVCIWSQISCVFILHHFCICYFLSLHNMPVVYTTFTYKFYFNSHFVFFFFVFFLEALYFSYFALMLPICALGLHFCLLAASAVCPSALLLNCY